MSFVHTLCHLFITFSKKTKNKNKNFIFFFGFWLICVKCVKTTLTQEILQLIAIEFAELYASVSTALTGATLAEAAVLNSMTATVVSLLEKYFCCYYSHIAFV